MSPKDYSIRESLWGTDTQQEKRCGVITGRVSKINPRDSTLEHDNTSVILLDNKAQATLG